MSDLFHSYMEQVNMKKFEIFAGLGGGFGGSKSHGIYEFNNHEEAMQYAYELACDEYDRYGSRFRSIDQIMQEDNIESEEDAEQVFNDERERWLSYNVKEVE